MQLSASLLAADYGRMREALARADAAGVHRFHFDFMDGHYVPNLALSPDHIRALRPYTGLPFDVHLELANPEKIIDQFNWEGVSTIILQADTLVEPTAAFAKVRDLGMRVGLGVNLDRPIAPLKAFFNEIDQFLVLGVQPGFGGQEMAPDTPSRVQEASALAADSRTEIAVDGGVNLSNAGELLQRGADVLVVGTAIFGADQVEATVSGFHRQTPPADV